MTTYYFQFRADLLQPYYVQWSSTSQEQVPQLITFHQETGFSKYDSKRDFENHEAGGEGDCLFYAINYSLSEGAIGVAAAEDVEGVKDEKKREKQKREKVKDHGKAGMKELRKKAAEAFFANETDQEFLEYLMIADKWQEDQVWMEAIQKKYKSHSDNPDVATRLAREGVKEGRAKLGNNHWGDHADIVNLMKILDTGIIVIKQKNEIYCPLVVDFNFPQYILIYNKSNLHFQAMSLKSQFLFKHRKLPQQLINTIQERCPQVKMRVLIVEPDFEANKTRIQEYVNSHRFCQVFYVRTIPTAVPIDGAYDRIFIPLSDYKSQLHFIRTELLERNGLLYTRHNLEVPTNLIDFFRPSLPSELDNSLLYPGTGTWYSFFRVQ